MTRRKLLFVTTRLFWPPTSGRRVSLWHYCRGLSEEMGFDVCLYSFLEAGQSQDMVSDRPSFVSDVTIARPVSRASQIRNILTRGLWDRAFPMQSVFFYSNGNVEQLKNLIDEIKPDLIVVDMIRLAPYIDDLNHYQGAVIADFDDLLSHRYAIQAEKEGGKEDLGLFGSSAPGILNSLMDVKPVRNAILGIERSKTENAERKYYNEADAVVLVSYSETDRLNALCGSDKAFTASLGVDASRYVNECNRNPKYDLCFVGNMNTAANRASLQDIVHDILQDAPARSLRVIGECPKEVEIQYCDIPWIEFTGRVDSISEEMQQCKVALCSVSFGSGIKTKVLEAMGYGVPVLTNDIGIEGIDARDGVDCLIRNDAEGMRSAIDAMLSSKDLRVKMAENAYRLVSSKYTWEKSIDDLRRCVDFALQRENAFRKAAGCKS